MPLVPGVGLYNTMRYVVEGQYAKAVSTGVITILAICGIALAVTITSVLFSVFAHKKHREKQAWPPLGENDSLASVTAANNVPISALLRTNPCLAPDGFKPGTTIRLPE